MWDVEDVGSNDTVIIPGGISRDNASVSGDGSMVAFEDRGLSVNGTSELVTYNTQTNQ